MYIYTIHKLTDMSFLKIRTSTTMSVILIIVGILFSGFFFLFGVANLINPEVSEDYLTQNTIACLVACSIGLGFLLLAIAALRGLLFKKKSSS